MRYYEEALLRRQEPKWDRLSWLTVRALVSAINDAFARGSAGLVYDTRSRWVAAQRHAGFAAPPYSRDFPASTPEFRVGFVFVPSAEPTQRAPSEFSCILLGDPGDADESQYAVVRPMLKVHQGERPGEDDKHGRATDCMLICSDVVYPAGDINNYINAFYVPYAEYDKPIFAIPGNHDWYDGLNGFMFHFCGTEPLPDTKFNWASYSLRELFFQSLWQRGSLPRRNMLTPFQLYSERTYGKTQQPRQPGPYWALDTRHLLFVGIDTGVDGVLDVEQGAWLRTVSRAPKDKVLITGKPLYVDNALDEGPILTPTPTFVDVDGEEKDVLPRLKGVKTDVDSIVRDPTNRYVAIIGGDVHNYQRYEVDYAPKGERRLVSLVSGGGGAYLSNTHRVPFDQVTSDGPPHWELKCLYPDRDQSVYHYVNPVHRALFKALLGLTIFTLAAIATAALCQWAFDPGGETTGMAFGGASAFVALLMIAAPQLVRRWPQSSIPAMVAWSFAAVAVGTLVVLGARWLLPADFREALLIGLGVLAAMAAPTLLDRHFDRRPWWLVALWGVAALFAVTWCLIAIYHVADQHTFHLAIGITALLLGFVVVVGVAGPGSATLERMLFDEMSERMEFYGGRRRKFHFWMALATLVVASSFLAWFGWMYDHYGSDVLLTQLTVAGALAFPLFALLVGNHLDRAVPVLGWLIRWIPVLLVAGGCWWIYDATDKHYLRIAIGVYLALTVLLAGVALLYLIWIRGVKLLLLFPDYWAAAVLTQADANAYIAARKDNTRDAVSQPAKRCFDTVMPWPPFGGTGEHAAKRSPLHRLVSEMFDAREPPFYKNFLHIEVGEAGTGGPELVIRAYGVTGSTDTAALIECSPTNQKEIIRIPLKMGGDWHGM
jgi:hypothetical protein